MINNYNELIGTTYYLSNTPYAIIENIMAMNNGYYRLFLKRGSCISKYIDLTSNDMILLYNEYLTRQKRRIILKERGVGKIVHFTKVDNLESIFEYGIRSVEQLDLLSIDYLNSDLYRLDGKLNGISTSISFPNYKMFYKKRMESPNTKWAVITIKPKIIIDKLDSEFYASNAANGMYSLIDAPTSNDDLLGMFCEENRDPLIPNSYTTDPQAEVLINNSIANNYFISVETKGNISKVKSLTRNAHIDYNANSQLFNARKDYKRW